MRVSVEILGEEEMEMITDTFCVSQLHRHTQGENPLFLPTMLIITIKLLVTM